MTDPLTLAYLAGAIDADGYITIQRSDRKIGPRYGHKPTYYLGVVGLGQACPTVPNLLKESFGGSLCEYRPSKEWHRRRWIWTVGTRQARDALVQIQPYLRIKHRQAERVIELADLIVAHHTDQRRTQIPPYRITPEQEASRRVLYEKVTALNGPTNRRRHVAVTRTHEYPQELQV